MTPPVRHDGMRVTGAGDGVMLRQVWETFVRKFVEKHVVAEVPDEMAACLDCEAEQCLDGVYETCPSRLGRAAFLSAARAQQPAGAADRADRRRRPLTEQKRDRQDRWTRGSTSRRPPAGAGYWPPSCVDVAT